MFKQTTHVTGYINYCRDADTEYDEDENDVIDLTANDDDAALNNSSE